MKILVISDTHGHLEKVYQVYEKLNDIDMIIHCGDYQRDGYDLEDTLGVRVVAVKGNCDGAGSRDFEIVETPAGSILVVHGHGQGAGYDNSRLLYLAEENDCIAVCYGHTHVPVNEYEDGIYIINPGSLALPRDGSNGSYAIIRSIDEDFYSNIVYYDTVFPPKTGKKVKGGFIRGMLNYSDRF